MNTAARTRTITARAKLVLDAPFFGALVLRLKLVEDPTCRTAWTDGQRIGYNPDFIVGLSHEEVVGVMVHEVLHCANGHPWRRAGRDPDDWNRGCDMAINPIVRDAGFALPDGVLFPEVEGKSAEWYTDRLPKPEEPEEPEPQGGSEGGEPSEPEEGTGAGAAAPEEESEEPAEGGAEGEGEGEPEGGGEPEPAGDDDEAATEEGGGAGEGEGDEEGDEAQDGGEGEADGEEGDAEGDLQSDDPSDWGEVRDAPAGSEEGEDEAMTEADWQQAVQQAAAAASARGDLPDALDRFAREAVEPRVDWASVLRRFVQKAARQDYSWRRPNPRYLPGTGLYLPALVDDGMGPMVIAVDTSASIDQVALTAFGAEVAAIATDLRPERVYVLYCDSSVRRVEIFERDEPVVLNARGGGYTRFEPVFAAVEELDEEPACLVYLTDLDGSFPAAEPVYPTLWASTDKHMTAPWGEVIYMSA